MGIFDYCSYVMLVYDGACAMIDRFGKKDRCFGCVTYFVHYEYKVSITGDTGVDADSIGVYLYLNFCMVACVDKHGICVRCEIRKATARSDDFQAASMVVYLSTKVRRYLDIVSVMNIRWMVRQTSQMVTYTRRSSNVHKGLTNARRLRED